MEIESDIPNEDAEVLEARKQIVFYQNEIKRLKNLIAYKTDSDYSRKLRQREYMKRKRENPDFKAMEKERAKKYRNTDKHREYMKKYREGGYNG